MIKQVCTSADGVELTHIRVRCLSQALSDAELAPVPTCFCSHVGGKNTRSHCWQHWRLRSRELASKNCEVVRWFSKSHPRGCLHEDPPSTASGSSLHWLRLLPPWPQAPPSMTSGCAALQPLSEPLLVLLGSPQPSSHCRRRAHALPLSPDFLFFCCPRCCLRQGPSGCLNTHGSPPASVS